MQKKPLSIKIMQGVLVLVLCIYIPALMLYVVREASNWRLIYVHGLLLGALGIMGMRLIVLSVFVAALCSIVRRSHHARLLGLTALAILFALWCYVVAHQGAGTEPFPLKSDGERGGALIGRGLIAIAFISLFVRFGFGKSARQYFAEHA